MKTEFDPVTHIGKVNGIIWPSVTQLLNESKLVDFSNVPDERLEFKRILGTRVHKATVFIDDGNFDEDHAREHFPEILPYLDAYRKFRTIEDYEPIPGAKETRYFSQKWRFHGAPDEPGIKPYVRDGYLHLLDYKCTFAMYASTGPQLCGYDILLRENAENVGIPKELLRRRTKRWGLLLKPNGNYELHPFEDPSDEQDFKAALWLHWRRREKYKTSKGDFQNGKSHSNAA